MISKLINRLNTSGDQILSWVFGTAGILLLARLIMKTTEYANTHNGQVNWFRVTVNLAIIGGLFAFALLLRRAHSRRKAGNSDTAMQPLWRRMAPVWALLLLAPWIGEYLLGNVPASSLFALPVLIPLYGGGALLIREISRRTNCGWPTILLLAVAYGLIEAGLVDQSLFNTSFEGRQMEGDTFIPALGINLNTAIAYISGHAIWSIGIPIAIVEALTPGRRTTPWLGKAGLALTGGLYAIGCVVIYVNILSNEGFTASAGQRISAAIIALSLIALAFAIGKRRASVIAPSRRLPKPRWIAVLACVTGSLFFVRPENWFGVGLAVILLALASTAVWRCSRQKNWTIRHEFALVVGTLPIYMVAGFVLTAILRPGNIIAWIGNVVFAILAVILLVVVVKRIRRTDVAV